jgi:hypothetical protein
MSNDLVQDKINEDGALLDWFQQHLADQGLEYTENGYGVLLGWAVVAANKFDEAPSFIPTKIDLFAVGTAGIPLSIAVNYADEQDLRKAIAMAVVDSVITFYGGAALAAGFTSLGPVAVAAGGVAIGYAATQLADYAWDRYIGPSADVKVDRDARWELGSHLD